MVENHRLKVLVSAYACSPYSGSEPGVGWGVVSEMARYHDLWVIVEEEKFRKDIEGYLSAHPGLHRNVHFYFLKKRRNRLLRRIWPPSYYWYYRSWQKNAYDLAVRLHDQVKFDLVHQLTMVGFREPGYLYRLGIPFVWGPIGGMGYFPWRFLPVLGVMATIYYLGYNCFNFWQVRMLDRPKRAARNAGRGLITATPENQAGALKYWGCRSTVITEVGVPRTVARDITHREHGEVLRIVWSGLHTPGKALGLALHAVSLLEKNVRWELHVLGSGSETERWKREARRRGISDRCHFHGWLSRKQALEIMGSSHLMLVTSLRDLTSTVILEGLVFGVPVICLDHCGFAAVITGECGIKVPVTSPSQVARDIASQVTMLWSDEARRQKLATGAIRRAQNFFWDEKGKQLNAIYDQVIPSL